MKGMTVIVKTIASWVKVLIILFGIYIILFGHLTPGGGFAGLGTSPCRTIFCRRNSGSGMGTADSSAWL